MQVLNMQAFADCKQIDATNTSSFNEQSFRSFIVNSINLGSARQLTIVFKKIDGSNGTIVVNAVRNTSDGRIILIEQAGLEIISIIDNTTLIKPAAGEVYITLLT